MKNFKNLTNEEICNHIFNDKRADFNSINEDHELTERFFNESEFTSRVVYEDKRIKVVYSYFEINEDNLIEYIFIKSSKWGRIKKSHFTIDGDTGEFNEDRWGCLLLRQGLI